MGYAKAAELNGYPGPAHVLELATPLKLSADQRARTQQVFDSMQKAAASVGRQLQAAGIKSILTRTGKHHRDIQVQTQWGPAYFPWPKNVAPALFKIYIANNGTAEVYTDENYSEQHQGALRRRVQCGDSRGDTPRRSRPARCRAKTAALARWTLLPIRKRPNSMVCPRGFICAVNSHAGKHASAAYVETAIAAQT